MGEFGIAGRRPIRALLAGAGSLALFVAAFVCGYFAAGGDAVSEATTFSDMRVLTPAKLQSYVAPDNPTVIELARRFRTPEAAYRYVRDQLAYDASLPVAYPEETLEAGEAGCLGKVTLLASIYRAIGIDHDDVRVVTGQVRTKEGPVEHAWVELGGRSLQQDPSTFLGTFSFDEFEGFDFSRAHLRRELFCFNDKGFAVVSQRNRFRGTMDPHVGLP